MIQTAIQSHHLTAGRDPAPGVPLTICVAVCSRDRSESLRRTLQSLMKQSRAPDEIIVVDNAPSDERTKLLIESEFAVVRYVLESVPGLDFARNRALREATADIVAFTDDDVILSEDWVRSIRRCFLEDPSLGICTGRVEALALKTEGQRLFEANSGFSAGKKTIRLIPPGGGGRGIRLPLISWMLRIGAGCSLAVWRDAALSIGGFDEAMDQGQVLPAGGDHDLIWRLVLGGWGLRYEPNVFARHEHRKDLSAAVQQILDHNRGSVAMLLKALRISPWSLRPGILTYLVWRLSKPGFRLFRRFAGRDPLSVGQIIRLWIESWRGLASYRSAQLSAIERWESVNGAAEAPQHIEHSVAQRISFLSGAYAFSGSKTNKKGGSE